MALCIGVEILTGQRQKWPQQGSFAEFCLFGHGGQPAEPRSSQQLQHQGFRLIVAMLCQQYAVSRSDQGFDGLVAGDAGGFLRAFAPTFVGIYPGDGQRNAKGLTGALAMCGPPIGIRVQSMVDMDGPDAPSGRPGGQCGRHVEQDGGIQSPAVGDPEGRWGRMPVKNLCEAGVKFVWQGRGALAVRVRHWPLRRRRRTSGADSALPVTDRWAVSGGLRDFVSVTA